ncbi:MAG: dihydrodipicolinate synthase family protein [candidate division NC10 bacterium]|nr:dihydrodipicolinate synthase family protein [candidate division NC10 bacterium]
MSVSPSKAMRPIRGVIPPVITPFTQTGEVSYKALVANLGQWNRTALAGYLILGSNSEFVYLSEEEKIRVLEVAREHIPADKVMIAGTGCEATEATITLTRRAAALGADFVMVVTPGYYKPLMRPRILIEHYRRVADASPIPVFLYNVPPFTGVVIDPRTVAQLAEHGNIVGMKDSAGNLAVFAEYVRQSPPEFLLFVGAGPVFLPALSLGARGGILAIANCAPEACLALYSLFQEGKLHEAREQQLTLLPAIEAVTTRFGIGGLKVAMDMLGYEGGWPRAPLLPPTDEEVPQIRHALVQAGLL